MWIADLKLWARLFVIAFVVWGGWTLIEAVLHLMVRYGQ